MAETDTEIVLSIEEAVSTTPDQNRHQRRASGRLRVWEAVTNPSPLSGVGLELAIRIRATQGAAKGNRYPGALPCPQGSVAAS